MQVNSTQPQGKDEPAQSERAKAIVRAALMLTVAERSDYVAGACGGEAIMLNRVAALLLQAQAETAVSEGEAQPFAGNAVAEMGRAGVNGGADLNADGHLTRLGGYTIVGLLGEGGMGQVYLAEQDRPRRTVALKVMRRGSVSPALLRRFEHESQMLARLQHSGIAQIYEAATAQTGQGPLPYFAMEYVKGRTLLEHVFALNCSTRERLMLFMRVCQAVQHAHQNGVIHRDLKPANIVVDNTGQPKVLDFGIARSTDADLATATLHTQAGQLIGTVPYMSPEQVAGDPSAIDTRSDVYALGVVLYELLTGKLPIAVIDRPMAEAARMIQHDEPVGIGSVDRSLRGDIQTIVGKALEKDRSRRYQSASDLEADIERYLRDEPILARPPSVVYQLTKFARRNRALVGGVVAAVLLLVAGAAATSWQAVAATRGQRLAEERRLEAEHSRRRAQMDANNAKNANAFLAEMLGAVNPEEGNEKDITVLELVDRAAAKLRDGGDDVYGGNNEGKRAGDGATADRAASRQESTYVRMSVHNTLSNTYRSLGRVDDSVTQAMLAVKEAERLQAEYPLDVISAKRTLAMELGETADYERVEQLVRECLASLEALRGWTAEQGVDERMLAIEQATTMGELGRILHLRGKYPQAQEAISQAIDALVPLVGERHKDVLTNLDHLGITLLAENKFKEAIATLERTRALREVEFGAESAVTAYTLNNLANAYQRSGDNEKALDLITRVVAVREKLLPPRHPSLLVSMSNLAVALTTAGRLQEARPLLHRSMQVQAEVLGEAHPKTLVAMGNLAFVCEDLGELDEAERLFRRVVELRRRVGREDPTGWPQFNNLAMLLMKRGKVEEAAVVYDELLTMAVPKAPTGDLYVAIFRNNYGECLTKLGRLIEADEQLTQSHAALVDVLKEGHPRLINSEKRRAELAAARREAEGGEKR